jgi:hypothetical protein
MPPHIHYRGGYKYQLVEDYAHQLGFHTGKSYQSDFFRLDGAFLLVYHGYAWDGPSGPTIDTDSFMRGSLVHDVLYQLMREGILDMEEFRPFADAELITICQEDGMNVVRRWYVRLLIKRFGDEAIEGGVKPPLIAPKPKNILMAA